MDPSTLPFDVLFLVFSFLFLEFSVRYGAGRGGFSLARPRPYTGPGGYVSGNPHPAPVRGPPALIP